MRSRGSGQGQVLKKENTRGYVHWWKCILCGGAENGAVVSGNGEGEEKGMWRK